MRAGTEGRRLNASSASAARTPGPAVLLLLVAAGGAFGALGRAGVAAILPASPGALPVATLAVNLLGCLLLGGLLAGRPGPRRQALLGTGVLGGFTTFSTFAVDVDALLVRAPVLGLAYALGSVAGGVVLAGLGARLASRHPRAGPAC